ncbi:MAG: hypothetical protein ACC613_09095 [Synergistales bacterium]
MAVTQIPLPAINNAIREVCSALEERYHQPHFWTNMTEDELWRELVACILGSRVRFEVAHSAVERMERGRLFCEHRRASRFQQYERDVLVALYKKDSPDEPYRYPFSRVRANQIRRAAEKFYGNSYTLRSFLENSHSIQDARRRLVLDVPGLGPKQTSLFLRNIGYAAHVAILDVHVLTYMSWVGLTETPIKVVPTVRKYEALEEAFIKHAYSFGYTPDRFDLAVWVVVRVAKEEQKTWE